MNTIDMRAIVTKADELNNDIVLVKRELKRIASVKCRLKYMPGKSTFNAEMTAALQEEQLLKGVRDYISGPRKNVNTVTQDDVDKMTLDEVMRAIKAIQSKKTHTRWQTSTPGDNDDYREACRIEAMLKTRRDILNPSNSGRIYKTDLQNLLDTLKVCNDLSTADCIARIEQFIEEV